MKNFLSLLYVCILISGCTTSFSASDNTVFIPVDSYAGTIIDVKDFATDADTMTFSSLKSERPFSSVQDFCLTDSFLYVLDKAKSLYMFSLSTGKSMKCLHNVGHGRNEYITPKAIVCADNAVFVLDFQGKCILKYDAYLNFVEKIRIDNVALDFTVVKDGFLYYNMNATDEHKQIVHTDFTGKEKDNFLAPDKTVDMMLGDKVFCEGGKGEAYFVIPFTDTIYKWTGKGVEDAYVIDFGKEKSSASKTSQISKKQHENLITCLVTPNYVFSQFLAERKVLTNVFAVGRKKSSSGMVTSTYGIPFLPMQYRNNRIYSLMLDANGQSYSMRSFRLVSYELKKS